MKIKNNSADANGYMTVHGSFSFEEMEADRKWAEAFANTTDEQFARLEATFAEEEEMYGTLPLDFMDK